MPEFKLDCQTCTDGKKVEKGCEKDSPIHGRWQIDDWKFSRCPLKMITRQSMQYIKAYNMFDKGYLPNAGGWLNQPVKFLMAINVIEEELGKAKKEIK